MTNKVYLLTDEQSKKIEHVLPTSDTTNLPQGTKYRTKYPDTQSHYTTLIN